MSRGTSLGVFLLREQTLNDASLVDYTAIVELVRRGDIRGEEELYRIFARAFRYLLARRVPSQDVEDRLHDTFIALAQAVRRGSLRNPAALPSFAHRILYRQVANTYRRRKLCVEPDAEAFEIADHKQSSLDVILQREERQGLEHALAELTPAERELIVRLYIDGESPKQIRGNMQLTEARFYSLKTRGRKKLLAMFRRPVQRSGHAHIVNQERLVG